MDFDGLSGRVRLDIDLHDIASVTRWTAQIDGLGRQQKLPSGSQILRV